MGKTNIKAIFVLAAVAAMAMSAFAQGRYTSRYSKNQVSNIIRKLENSSDRFSRDFKNQMDRSRRDGTSREDRFNSIVENYENALDELRRNFNNSSRWWDARNDVQGVMNDAQQVNSMMNQLSFRRNLEAQWRNMRTDLNTLADTFDLPGLDGGGWQGGGGGWNPGNPGWGNPARWAVGTFYGRAPQTGAAIMLTIAADGNVTANIGGSASYGNLRGDLLTIGSSQGRVYRTNNGIRTVSTTDGETIEYSRNGGGGWNPGDPGWGSGSAPRWAVGTFYGRNPNSGGGITMTIQSDGRVSIIFDGSPNVTYATLYNDTLRVGDSTARVTRIRNGLRTTSTTDGLTIDYFRR